jgi:hypothetical protein
MYGGAGGGARGWSGACTGVPGGWSGACWRPRRSQQVGLESTGGFAVDSFPMGPGLGQAVETVWRWYTRAPGMLGARSRQPGAERPQVHPSTTNIYFWADLCRYIYLYTHTMSSDIYPHPIVPTHRGPPRGPGSRPMPPRCPPPPHPRPDEAAMPPGSPRGLPPPLRANWSTRLLRDAQHPIADWSIAPAAPQHPVADWSIPPALLHLPPPPVCWLRSPPPAPRPPPRPPSQLAHPPPPLPALPPKGSPCWHHRATRGLPGVGYPPGARPSTTPARVGVVHNRP